MAHFMIGGGPFQQCVPVMTVLPLQTTTGAVYFGRPTKYKTKTSFGYFLSVAAHEVFSMGVERNTLLPKQRHFRHLSQ